MSKEKQNEEMAQIEEMAKVIEIVEQVHRDAFYKLPSPRDYAKNLYTRGYRRQRVGEWIEASNKPHAACGKKCSLCGARISYREFGHGNHKYCHKCGAKMKGGADGGGEQ